MIGLRKLRALTNVQSIIDSGIAKATFSVELLNTKGSCHL